MLITHNYFLKVKYANETALPLKYKKVQSSQFDFFALQMVYNQ